MKKLLIGASLLALLSGCATPVWETKGEAFPKMYDAEQKPVSMVVVPAVNKTTAADATDLIFSTLTVPFADNGYYVMPMPIVAEIFQNEGIVDGEQLKGVPVETYKDSFGADSVLYVTINNWETNYFVVGGNVTVGLSYLLVSTTTGESLWSYDQVVVIDTTSSDSGNPLIDMISTAIQTAVQDYIPIAYQANSLAVATMPHGKYHPNSGLDAEANVVLQSSRLKGEDQ